MGARVEPQSRKVARADNARVNSAPGGRDTRVRDARQMHRRLAVRAAAVVIVAAAAALHWPPAVAADPAQRVFRVGFLSMSTPSTPSAARNAFWDRMRELGYVEGQNLAI